MKSRPVRAAVSEAIPSLAASRAANHPAIKALGVLAFVLLATALCSRALLSESRSATVAQLVSSPENRTSGTLMARHAAHLVAAGGIGLAAAWMALSRRRWRLCGLEIGTGILVVASLLSVPAASDKRVAINLVLDAIVPLAAVAVLYQVLADRLTWRRAMLAGLIAMAAANCWQATVQYAWEYPRRWQAYQQNKTQFWAQQGIPLNDPQVVQFEAENRAARPMGFIQGPNVFSSFLLLGLAASGAAALGSGWRRGTGRPARQASGSNPATVGGSRALQLTLVFAAALAIWHVVILTWVHTAGSMVAFLMALGAAVAAVLLRDRPRRLAIVLASALLLLQTLLVVLAMGSEDLHKSLLDTKVAGGKVRTLAARLCYWQGTIRLFEENPLTGVGPGQFGNRYLPVRPAYLHESNPAPLHSHNWLLNMAAEWGVFGALGLLAAFFGGGWTLVRGLGARPPDDAPRPRVGAAMLATLVVVLACWLMLALDLPRGLWSKTLFLAMAVSLVAGMLASLCAFSGRAGQVVLLAGIVGFFVHCTVEVTPSVPGIMWPFWGLMAAAMAWAGAGSSTAEPAPPRGWMWAGPILAGAAALAIIGMTLRPMRAVALMHKSQQAVVQGRTEAAVGLLRTAAATDPLDPLPLRTAAFLEYRLAQANPARTVEHFRQYVELSRAAVDRNPLDHGFWRASALAKMFLATATADFTLVDEAIEDMRRSLELNPLWSEGWIELARMAAVETGPGGESPARLQVALDAVDKAFALDDRRPANVPASLTARQRSELAAMRAQVLRRLEVSKARPPTTVPAR